MRPSAAVQVPAPALLSEGLSRDPYAVYTALRAAGPVVWSDIRCLDPEPQWVENAVFRGLRSLRLARTEARDGLGPPLAAPR
jgi:hypothetical protein